MILLTAVLLFASLASVAGRSQLTIPELKIVVCPDGYDRYVDGACYKIVTNATNVLEAARECHTSGGHLAEIPSFEVNSRISHNSNKISMSLGLICTGTKITSCTYISGEDLTATSYTNFAAGHPNPENGTCIYLNTFGNHTNYWLSGDCAAERGYVCQKTRHVKITECGSGYTEHNGKCYKVIRDKLSAAEARKTCSAQCGNAVQIDSKEENEFVRRLFVNGSNSEVWIGMNLAETVIWNGENTITYLKEYQNFGHLHKPLGECLIMSLDYEFVQKGQWINKNCDKKIESVCERSIANSCGKQSGSAENEMIFRGYSGLMAFYRSEVVVGRGRNRIYRSYDTKQKVHRYTLDPLTSYDNGFEQQGDLGYYMNETTYNKIKGYCPELKKVSLQQYAYSSNFQYIHSIDQSVSGYTKLATFYCAPRLDYCGANFQLVGIYAKSGNDRFYPKSLAERQEITTSNDYKASFDDPSCFIWQPEETRV